MVIVFILLIMEYFAVLLFVKNVNTNKNMQIILEAISKWGLCNSDVTISEYKQMLDSMADYEQVLFRLNDWGYLNILPADKYEKIKPFLV